MAIKDRTLINDQQTYDYSTPGIDVVARPTDPYLSPVANSSAMQLINSLEAFQSGVKSFAEYQKIQNQKQNELGMLQRSQNKDLPKERKTIAFIDGWEQLDGELKAKQDYKAAVNDYFVNNQHLPKDEFEAGLQKLSQEYMNGSTKSFLKGFAPNALDIETSALNAYQTNLTKQVREELTTKTIQLFKNDITDNIVKLIPGTSSLTDLSQNTNNAYVNYYSNKIEFGKQVAPQIRTYLNDKLAMYKQMGMKTKEISSLMLDAVGTLAYQYGIPELLDYAELKDKSGVAISSDPDLSKEYLSWKSRAESTQSDMLRMIANQNKKTFAEKTNSYAASLYVLNPISNPQDMQKAKDIFNQMTQDPVIMGSEDTGTVRSIFNLAESRFNYEQPDAKKDQRVISPLYSKYLKGSLTLADLNNAWAQHLTPEGESKLKMFYDELTKDPTKKLGMNDYDSRMYSATMESISTWYKTAYSYTDPMLEARIANNILDEYLKLKRQKGSVGYKEWDDITKSVEKMINPINTPSTSTPNPSRPQNTPQTTTSPKTKTVVSYMFSKDKKWKKITYSDGTTETVENK